MEELGISRVVTPLSTTTQAIKMHMHTKEERAHACMLVSAMVTQEHYHGRIVQKQAFNDSIWKDLHKAPKASATLVIQKYYCGFASHIKPSLLPKKPAVLSGLNIKFAP